MATPSTIEAPTDWAVVPDAPGLDESRFAEDGKLFVQFYRRPCLQPGESAKAGRAIYKEIDYIKIMVPGDKLSVVDTPLDEISRRRFADKYEKWLAGAGNVVEGTPLSALPKMTPAKIEEYRYFNITTVEQLASASDAVGQKFFGFSDDKRSASAFLDMAKGNAPLAKMRQELKERDTKIDRLEAKLLDLDRKMNAGKTERATPSE